MDKEVDAQTLLQGLVEAVDMYYTSRWKHAIVSREAETVTPVKAVIRLNRATMAARRYLQRQQECDNEDPDRQLAIED